MHRTITETDNGITFFLQNSQIEFLLTERRIFSYTRLK